MSAPRILSVDPGITTGIATYIDRKYQTCVIPKSFEAVYDFLIQIDWDLVILEGFATPGLISSYGIDTVELVGAIKALCWYKKIKLVVQYPPERRNSLDDADAVLRDVLHKKHYPDHERDALAHILAYQRKVVYMHKRQQSDNQ